MKQLILTVLTVLTVLSGVARAGSATDTCQGPSQANGNVSHAPCTLPCTADSTPTMILPVEGGRSDLIVCNQDATNTLFVLIGQTTLNNQTPSSGIPVNPQTCFHSGIQPVSGSPIRTYSTDIWVVTAGASIACSYSSKVN